MAAKYFNQEENFFEGRRDNLIEDTDVGHVLSTSNHRRKIYDGVFTNEMGLINMNDIQCDPMEFQIGGFNPTVGSELTTRLYDPLKEKLVIQINDVSIDTPMNNIDILTYYGTKFKFPDEGGTDCVLGYMFLDHTGTETGKGFATFANPVKWTEFAIHAIPLISNRKEYDMLIEAYFTHYTKHTDAEFQNKDASRQCAMRFAWHYLLHAKYPQATRVEQVHLFGIDFFNVVSKEYLHYMKRYTNYKSTTDAMKAGVNFYREKNVDGSLPRNELGALLATMFGTTEGYYMPCMYNWENSGPYIGDTFFRNLFSSSFSALFHTFFDEFIPNKQRNNATDFFNSTQWSMEGLFPHLFRCYRTINNKLTYLHMFELMLEPEAETNGNFLKLISMVYPFMWICRDAVTILDDKEYLKMWKQKTANKLLQSCMTNYGSYSNEPYIAYTQPSEFNFSNVFGHCNIIIDQAKSLHYNRHKSISSGMIRFEAHVNNHETTYVPRLITPSTINFWDNETTTLTPTTIRILTQKFNSKPPFKSGSKLTLSVSLYAYSTTDV